jgi:hypothetical protein
MHIHRITPLSFHPEERVVIDSGLSTADKDLMSDVCRGT